MKQSGMTRIGMRMRQFDDEPGGGATERGGTAERRGPHLARTTGRR